MSLDVYLESEPQERKWTCSECGSEIISMVSDTLFEANITHNLGRMAAEAGIYEALWRPEEIGAKEARDIVPLLKEGYQKLLSDPKKYEAFNASNGWGIYDDFVPWVKKYLDACIEHPEANIRVSR